MAIMAKNSFGDAWETYPVAPGEIWTVGPHRFLCGDVTVNLQNGRLDELFNGQTAMSIYTDPPWNPGNQRMFHTFADAPIVSPFPIFLKTLLSICHKYCPDGLIFFDMGLQWGDEFVKMLELEGGSILGRNQTFYGHPKRPSWTLATTFNGAHDPITIPDGLYGNKTIDWVMSQIVQPGSNYFDPCCGKLNHSYFAAFYGATVYGCELIPRKLAQGLKLFKGLGYEPRRN
jgi:hypothetical protein